MKSNLLERPPLELTQNVLDISATERATFRTCRRRWELEVLDNLTPKAPSSLELEFGTGIHAGLEGYYSAIASAAVKQQVDPVKQAVSAWDSWFIETEERFEADKSLPSETKADLLDKLVELGDLGEEMLRGYHQCEQGRERFTVHAIEGRLTGAGESWLKKHWEEREFLSEHSASAVVLHPSRRLLVPILNPRKQVPLRSGAIMSCRLDLLVLRTDPGMKGLWIYDHKSTSSMPNDKSLDFNDQITSYCYAVWRWLGIVPRGVCMNYLIKHAPKEPRILKKGDLSTAKDQLTTADRYREELIERGLMLKDGTIKDEKYKLAYEALLSRGWDPFFQRHYAGRNKQELVAFEERLYDEYSDMVKAYNGNLALYPNFSPPHTPWCTWCRVAPICQALEDGSDVEGIIESRYTEAPDRKADLHDS